MLLQKVPNAGAHSREVVECWQRICSGDWELNFEWKHGGAIGLESRNRSRKDYCLFVKPRAVRGGLEQMQAKLVGNLLANFDAANTIATSLELGRKNSNTKLARHNGHDASAFTALGWKPDTVGPLAGAIV
jgi:hypothetical protein